jgi:hypothetical protein
VTLVSAATMTASGRYHISDSEQADARVASSCRDQDRDDGPISQVKRVIPGAAPFESPEIV